MIRGVKLLVVLFSFVLMNCHADSKYAKGHWFYKNNKKNVEQEQHKKVVNGVVVIRPSREVVEQQIKAIKEEAEYRKNLAFLYPSHENVKWYREFQAEVVQQSSVFADSWMYVTSTNPHLDANVQAPMSQLGSSITDKEKDKQASKIIRKLGETHGLYFVYMGTCPYCRQMASILKSFAENHGLDLIGMSVDGVIIDEIPNNQTDIENNRNLADQWGVKKFPATVIYDAETNSTLPPIHGMLTEDIFKISMLRIILQGAVQ